MRSHRYHPEVSESKEDYEEKRQSEESEFIEKDLFLMLLDDIPQLRSELNKEVELIKIDSAAVAEKLLRKNRGLIMKTLKMSESSRRLFIENYEWEEAENNFKFLDKRRFPIFGKKSFISVEELHQGLLKSKMKEKNKNLRKKCLIKVELSDGRFFFTSEGLQDLVE